MADAVDEQELKGGHPPAVKAGGMRITQHKPPTTDKPAPEPAKEKTDEENEEQAVKPASPPKAQLMISGVLARGNADFPTEAVKAIHEKPEPSMDFRVHSSKPNIIHQPRK